MTFSVLCNEPAIPPCPPQFRVRASAWLDPSNIGDNPVGSSPPAGIRLRWNCPFLDPDPTARPGTPTYYEVQRSGSMDPQSLWLPTPNVGHIPRTPTPKGLWRPLTSTGSVFFAVDGNPCRGADAVYFEVPAGAPTVTVTLLTTAGGSPVTGEVTGGDIFYFELGQLKSVVFSGPCPVREVLGLFLDAYETSFDTIAVIDARRWAVEPLGVVSERIATQSGGPYVTLNAPNWAIIQAAGSLVLDALNTGTALPAMSLTTLQLAAALRWEAATLMSWGFIDGEHPANPVIDQIQMQKMLSHADNKVYAYRIMAVIRPNQGGEVRIPSVPSFALASHAPQLSPVVCRPVQTPVTRIRLTNMVNPGPVVTASPQQKTYCATSWDLETKLPMTEIIFTRPVGDNSAITGEAFIDPGEFTTGSNPLLIRFRGLTQIQRRDLQFGVPYFDCDVGLELAAGDGWDRRKQLSPTSRIQPRIEYEGDCIPVAGAHCDSNLGTDGRATVNITLDAKIGWQADPFAARGGGNIALLMQDPSKSLLEADVTIGPAFPTLHGDWIAEVTSNLTQAELDLFVDGTLTVGGLTARVKAFAPRSSGSMLCTFEVTAKCAGVSLYSTGGGTAAAHLRENQQSDRLWIDLAKSISVLSTGQPAKFTEQAKLPILDHSMMLKFATRLIVQFGGQLYPGPISIPYPAPYIHPAPDPPRICFNVDQLGTDYYGRAMLRIDADRCPPLDPQFAMRVTMASGADLTKDQYLSDRILGLFGPQAVFERRRVFEAFDALARQPEGSAYTIGIAYVREADNRESDPVLQSFTARRVE